MDRRAFLCSQTMALGIGLTGLAFTASCSGARKSETAQSNNHGVMVAIPLVKTPTSTDDAVIAQVRVFVDYISKASGFLDATLLKPATPNVSFDDLDVTRWQSQQNWEDLHNSPDFLALLRANSAFTLSLASVFVPAPL